jgi:hypothetical protein
MTMALSLPIWRKALEVVHHLLPNHVQDQDLVLHLDQNLGLVLDQGHVRHAVRQNHGLALNHVQAQDLEVTLNQFLEKVLY